MVFDIRLLKPISMLDKNQIELISLIDRWGKIQSEIGAETYGNDDEIQRARELWKEIKWVIGESGINYG